MSWTTAILQLVNQETDLLMKVNMKCVNRKLWDILGCFHNILNAPRISTIIIKIKKKKHLWLHRIAVHGMWKTVSLTIPLYLHVYKNARLEDIVLHIQHTFSFKPWYLECTTNSFISPLILVRLTDNCVCKRNESTYIWPGKLEDSLGKRGPNIFY